jgi:O-antigen ligase
MGTASAYLDHHGEPAFYAARRRGVSRQRLRMALIDGLWILFLFGATSATNALSHNSERYFWFAGDLAVVGLLVVHHQELLRFSSHNKLLLSWPLLACFSTLWSLAPATSMYHGLQLLMTTLIAFALCMLEGRRKVVKLVFLALTAACLGSILFELAYPVRALGSFGEWRGLYHHKNELGVYSALLSVTGICLFLQRWRPFVSAAGTGLGLALLTASQSGGALVCFVVAMSPIPLAICYRQGHRTLSLGLAASFILGAILLVIVFATNTNLLDAVLGGLGKDRTLTGRLILWDLGTQAFLSHPWLGLGYKGFWEGATASVHHLRLVIGQDLWFFHNNVLEVAVAFGIMGPVFLLSGIAQALFRTARAFIRDRQYTSLWGLLIVLYLAMYMNAENPLFQNHSFHHMLFVIAAALQVAPLAARQRRTRRPIPPSSRYEDG